jgi:ABC-type transport system involved in multi-copper enzyme maturation permease subunit
MNWFTWEQHKKLFLTLGVALALYAVLAITLGSYCWHIYQQALMTCGPTHTCGRLEQTLFQSGLARLLNPNATAGGLSLFDVAVLSMPFLLGMFVGAPLIAHEYAEGTNKLVWTRSVSRRQWLTVKLLWILIATALFAGAFAVFTTWWSRAGNALFLDRFSGSAFTMQGIVPIGYAVLAVSLGVMFGTLFKRTLLALAVTLGVLLAVQITIPNWVRPHLQPPRHTTLSLYQRHIGTSVGPSTFALTVPTIPGQPGSWVLSSHAVNAAGLPVTAVPAACRSALGISQGSGDSNDTQSQDPLACLAGQGLHVAATYQPAYRYWDFQRIETGIYLALSLIPLGATYWLVLKRDA